MRFYLIASILLSITFNLNAQSSDQQAALKELAETIDAQIRGVDIGNGIIGRGCVSAGDILVYQYDVPDDWSSYPEMKEDIVSNLKTAGVAKMYIKFGLDVSFYYFKGNRLAEKISVKHEELSELSFELGEYISISEHPKAKGVNLKIRVPEGWSVEEADRPNIVKKFVFDTNSYLILIKEIPGFVSRNEARELFDDEQYVSEMTQDAVSSWLTKAKLLDSRVITLDNYPALEFSASGLKEQAGVELNVWSTHWIIPYEDRFVMLQSHTFDERSFDELGELFKRISNSVVFPDQYD